MSLLVVHHWLCPSAENDLGHKVKSKEIMVKNELSYHTNKNASTTL